jgi:hypothetical protein
MLRDETPRCPADLYQQGRGYCPIHAPWGSPHRFLGYSLDERTMTYGPFPAEAEQEVADVAELHRWQVGQGLRVLAAIDAVKHRYQAKDIAESVESTREQWDEVMPVSDPMAEFPSNGWSMFLLAVTLVGVVGYAVLMSGGAL